jgi:hypothetical protein
LYGHVYSPVQPTVYKTPPGYDIWSGNGGKYRDMALEGAGKNAMGDPALIIVDGTAVGQGTRKGAGVGVTTFRVVLATDDEEALSKVWWLTWL